MAAVVGPAAVNRAALAGLGGSGRAGARSPHRADWRPAAQGRERRGLRPSALVPPEGGQERGLGNLHVPILAHLLLALLLLLEKLAFPGDVAAIALGRHVLA